MTQHGRGKKTAWQVWQAYIWRGHTSIWLLTPSNIWILTLNTQEDRKICCCTVWQFVVLYDKTNSLSFVNEAREELFCHKRRSIDNIPLLKMHYFNIHGALCTKLEFGQALRHIKCYHLLINLLSKSWEPIWITIPQVSKAYSQLIKCACKGDCTRCKCAKADLTCSPLCNCKCNQ